MLCHDPSPSNTYNLSLHDALPICLGELREGALEILHRERGALHEHAAVRSHRDEERLVGRVEGLDVAARDRKSTRLNSSHLVISYAVFCLKKKKRRSGKQKH